jgi:hypothetical protein
MLTHRFARLGFSTAVNLFRVIEDTADPNSNFVHHPGWKHRGYLHTDVRERLQKEVVRYIEDVNKIIQSEANPITRKGPAEVRPPVIALVRAHNSAFCMRFPHLTYRDLVEYVAGLQRSVAELQAYIMWYDRIQYGDIPASTRSFELGLQGTVAKSVAEYNTLRKLGVPVWLALPLFDADCLDGAKKVTPQPMRVEKRIGMKCRCRISCMMLTKGSLCIISRWNIIHPQWMTLPHTSLHEDTHFIWMWSTVICAH